MQPPQVVSLFEHQAIAYARLPGLPAGPARERLLEQIEQINRAAGVDILHLGRKELRAGALVGVLRAGPLTIEILPKIDQASEAGTDPRNSALHNLLVMLSYAAGVPLYAQAAASLSAQAGPWLELLTRMFAVDLARQVRAGLAHQYVAQEDHLPALRGRWNLQRQVTRPAQARQRFAVTYDVLSPDIPLNQALRHAAALLIGITQDAENLALLREIDAALQPVSLLADIPTALLDAMQFDRLNDRFRPAFQLARLVLTGRSIQLSAGPHPAYAFVFDMNVLFERFVTAFIRRHHASLLPPGWQTAALIEQSAGRRWFLAHSAGKPAFRLRPDLVLQRHNDPAPLLVADMKYKRLDPAALQSGANQADIYQMLAYTARLDCPRGLLLYPQAAGRLPIRREFSFQLTGQPAAIRLYAATLNLRAPLEPPDALIQELREIILATRIDGRGSSPAPD